MMGFTKSAQQEPIRSSPRNWCGEVFDLELGYFGDYHKFILRENSVSYQGSIRLSHGMESSEGNSPG